MNALCAGRETKAVIYRHRANKKTSWHRLDADYEITVDSRGEYGVLIRREDNSCQRTWYNGVCRLFLGAYHEWKSSIANLCPKHVRFSMMCAAEMQQKAGELSFGLNVICFRKHSEIVDPVSDNTVGGTIAPILIRPGTVSIRVLSEVFEADVLHGETNNLCKLQHNFCGRDFDKQFACRFKSLWDSTECVVFGKVLVEMHGDNGKTEPIIEFNLRKTCANTSPTALASRDQYAPVDEQWSILAVKELAAMLRVSEDDNWKICARRLGYSDEQIRRELTPAEQPFDALLFTYRRQRRGSAVRFFQALYESSRELNVNMTSSSPVARAHDSFLHRLACRQQQPPESDPNALGREDRSGQSEENRDNNKNQEGDDEGDDGDDECDALTVPVSDLHPVIPTGSSLCLTPPPTPRKRSSSISAPGVASKRTCRQLKYTEFGTRDFDFHQIVPPEPHAEAKCFAPDVLRRCSTALPGSVLWQVSAHAHAHWKTLGRALDVPETELMCIEHAHKDGRERAYETLLRWRQLYPERHTFGALYSALCDSGQQTVARKCCSF